MGPAQAIFSSVISILYYAMVIAAVWKLFQIATDMGEIKNILTDMRRSSSTPLPLPKAGSAPAAAPQVPPVFAGPISLESAEALLREVEAESRVAEQQPR